MDDSVLLRPSDYAPSDYGGRFSPFWPQIDVDDIGTTAMWPKRGERRERDSNPRYSFP